MLRLSIVVMVAVLGCAGCTGSEPGPESKSKSEQAGDVPSPPEVGQCRDTPESNLDPEDWVDDSPVVECTQPHTLQTVGVINSYEPFTLELVQQLARSCESPSVANYVDSPGAGVYNLVWPIVYGPNEEQVEAGQSWVRCDAGFLAETQCCRLVPQTGSLEGAMGKNLARFQQCIAEIPRPDRSQPLTSCEEPHRAELLLTSMELQATEYPSAAKLEKSGQSLCGDLVAERDDADSLVLTTSWQPENEWEGGTILGRCWIHRESGLLPAA